MYACASPYYYIVQNTQENLIYSFDYESYKYNSMEIYAVNSDDLSSKELIASYDLEPKMSIDNFNILDLSSLYFKHKETITLSIDSDSSGISVSRNGDKIGLGKNNLFNVNLNDYNITSCIKEEKDSVTVLHIDSKMDDSYIYVFIQFNK